MTRKNVPQDLYDRLKEIGDCLIFTGQKDRKGYGRLSWDGKQVGAHRLAWIIAKGSIKHGFHVLHSCDQPACCNLDHLRVGSNQDNVDDAVQKQRHSHGETHGRHRLTTEDVKQIRGLSGPSHRQLARLYGVGWRAIQKVRKNERWRV